MEQMHREAGDAATLAQMYRLIKQWQHGDNMPCTNAVPVTATVRYMQACQLQPQTPAASLHLHSVHCYESTRVIPWWCASPTHLFAAL